jgi:hypothetical protein
MAQFMPDAGPSQFAMLAAIAALLHNGVESLQGSCNIPITRREEQV